MTRRAIQLGLLVLVAIMPFHAFLSVWLGQLTGQQTLIQAWKEVLLLVLAGLTSIEVWRHRELLERLRQPWVWALAGFTAVALFVTLITRPPLATAAFGIKTDLEFLLAALIALLVATPNFVRRLIQIVLIGGAAVCSFGLLQAFVLPVDFLTRFGYGPDTIQPFLQIAAGSDALRFGATLGGPNQLGTYLILIITLSLWQARKPGQHRWWLVLSSASFVVLFNTHSRSAWIGAIVAATATLVAATPARYRRRVGLGMAAAAVAGLLGLSVFVSTSPAAQYYVLHSRADQHDEQTGSDSQRLASIMAGARAAMEHPLGHGLGTAGPATLRADPDSENVIENYYLQIAYEAGVVGGLLFVVLLGLLIHRLSRHSGPNRHGQPVAAALVGLSVVALALPAWTDSTTSLILMTVAGSLAAPTKGDSSV